MPFNATCWTRPQTAPGIGTLLLPACAGVGSDDPPGVCPTVVEYSRAEQALVANEVAALPEGAVVVAWLADYAVLREQARGCKSTARSKTALDHGGLGFVALKGNRPFR